MACETALRKRPASQAEAARAAQPRGPREAPQRARACTSSKARLGSLDVMTGRLLRRLRRLPAPSIVVKLPGSSSPARPGRRRARAAPPTSAAGQSVRGSGSRRAGAPAGGHAHLSTGWRGRACDALPPAQPRRRRGRQPTRHRQAVQACADVTTRAPARPPRRRARRLPAAPRRQSVRGGGEVGALGAQTGQYARPCALARRRASAPGAPHRAPAAPMQCTGLGVGLGKPGHAVTASGAHPGSRAAPPRRQSWAAPGARRRPARPARRRR